MLERRPRSTDDAHVGEVRGLGLFVGIEIVADRDDHPTDRTARIRRAAFDARCSARAATTRTRHRCASPLTIDERLLDTALELTID